MAAAEATDSGKEATDSGKERGHILFFEQPESAEGEPRGLFFFDFNILAWTPRR
jgi:hypothetical protein